MRYATLFVLLIAIPSAALGQQASPEISISANNTRNLSLYPGWPLIVHVTIMNSIRDDKTSSTPLVIAPTGAIWTTAISFAAVSSGGQTAQWPLTQVGTASDSSLTLAKKSYVNAAWQMSADSVSSLPSGQYQLTATVQVSNSSGWTGLVRSEPVAITVGPEPTLSSNEQSQKALLLAEYSLNAGDVNGAVATANQLHLDQPNNPSAAIATANALAIAGYDGLALLEASEALDMYYQFNPIPSEAPSDLLNMYQKLLTTVSTAGTPALTSTIAPHDSITFNPTSQAVPLSASVTAASGAVNGGTVTFTATGLSGSALSGPVTGGAANANFTVPGGTPAASYALKAAYSGTAEFAGSNDSGGSLLIGMATPTITWSTPGAVAAGTVLGPSQLNAAASVPGTFVYDPPGGTVVGSGTSQLLMVTFTPADAVDYHSATASVSLGVIAGSYSGSVSPSEARIKVGSSQAFSVTINSTNYVGAVSLGCADPPAGVSCSFSARQINLTANGNSSSVLIVSVNAKPQSAILLPFHSWPNPPPNSYFRTRSPWPVYVLIFLMLAMLGLRHTAPLAKPAFQLSLTMALLILVALTMSSCMSSSLSGPGSGGGGSGSAATVHIVVQGTAGSSVESLGTLSITVP
ncbi:MAG TPA: Ig-like domain-containing protein [Candidatus Saccharimonadales bacterium]|nr:Ig-like domain-containing protein [Candidatus Saccharimonadales bacterium]